MTKGSGIWGDETDDDRKKTVKKSRKVAATQLAAATLDAVSPTTGATGVAVLLTATGTGFVDGDVIAYGIEDLATAFVDSTTLTASVTPIDPGPHDVLVRCADGDTNAVSFEATGEEPVTPSTGAECLEALKTGDTSLLAGCPADELAGLRVQYKDWMRAEHARVEALWNAAYAAVTSEMARKGVAY